MQNGSIEWIDFGEYYPKEENPRYREAQGTIQNYCFQIYLDSKLAIDSCIQLQPKSKQDPITRIALIVNLDGTLTIKQYIEADDE